MAETATATDADGEERTYNGLFGAFPYAFRSSESRLFRAYVVLGGLAALLIAVGFALALVKLLGDTVGAGAGVFTFSRSFYIVVALAVVAPLLGPVLFVARRHRRVGSKPGYDRALGAMGFLFLASLYVLLVISAPANLRDPVSGSGVGATVIQFLYDLPRLWGLIPPTVVGLAMYLTHRLLR